MDGFWDVGFPIEGGLDPGKSRRKSIPVAGREAVGPT